MSTIEFRADPNPQLAQIMLVRGDPVQARAALRALAAATDGSVPTETVLVRFAETPAAAVVDETRGARVLTAAADIGTAASWNIAIGQTSAPFVATVHEDAEVPIGWAAALLQTMSVSPRIGVVGPRLLHTDGTLQNCGWVILRDGHPRQVDRELPESAEGGLLEVDTVSSACMIFRRSLFDALGGFDERFFPAVGVEIDFTIACRAAGDRVVCDRDVAVLHHGGAMVRPEHLVADTALRGFLIDHNVRRLGAKWATFLADCPPAPEPGASAAAAAAIRLSRLSGGRPTPPARIGAPRPIRPISAGATPTDDGTIPAGVSARADAARNAVMFALVGDLAAERDRYAGFLGGAERQIAWQASLLAERDRVIAELHPQAEILAAVLGGRWWRLRNRLNRVLGRG